MEKGYYQKMPQKCVELEKLSQSTIKMEKGYYGKPKARMLGHEFGRNPQ